MTRKGLPHSEIPGSKPVCGSPGLIAACHVLHRLCAPRHPPSTLSSLTIKYLRRVVCILIYPILLSKTSITRIKRPSRGSRGPFHPSIRRRSLCALWRDLSAVARSARYGGTCPPSLALRAAVVRFVSMVEPIGIEPTTYGLQSRRSPS
jgi:hypothetical protein